MDCVCVRFRGWMGKTKYLSAFWMGDSSRCQTHRFVSRTATLQFHAQHFSVCLKNVSPPKGHPANLTQLWEALEWTWASIPVECFRHIVESMPWWIEAVLRAKTGVQLNVRNVFLMFCKISVYVWCVCFYKLGGSSRECCLADHRGILDRIPQVWQNMALWYMANIPLLRAVSRHSALHRT
jgi:hypothetical protein